MTRIAILDKSRCVNGASCNFICGKYCPVNRTGGECIVINPLDNKPEIDEDLCTGCGICPKRCPVGCIQIVNLPEKLDEDPVHRFGVNSFELFSLPTPKPGKVVGILGRNGIGKSTALNILANQFKPNFGKYKEEQTEEKVIQRYSNIALGDYFRKLYKNEIRISYKPQRIEILPKIYSGKVKDLLKKIDEKNISEKLLKELSMEHLKERNINELSGGELQRVAIIATASKKADVYYFDEPASFLDIMARIKVAKLIRNLADEYTSVIVVEHDLATLDYISDELQIVYGQQAAYGIFSGSKSVRRGINEYMDGFLPEENIRFRKTQIRFSGAVERALSEMVLFSFPKLEKKFETFSLEVNEGDVRKGEVLAIMGANGLGKTTFLKMLAGELKPDNCEIEEIKIAYKEQYPENNIDGRVGDWLKKIAGAEFNSGWYKQNILEKMGIDKIMENNINKLSGGELQKIHIAATLSKDVDVYAFDEPSAFIDVEDRLVVAEVIKEFMVKKEKCAIVVDHDVQFIDYIGDSMLVFKGEPGKEGYVIGPMSKKEGMNEILRMLDITYRLDKETGRPRINKPESQLDVSQRKEGKYYYS